MKKLCCILLFIVLFVTASGSAALAYAEGEYGADEYVQSFLEYKNCASMQEYLDGARSGAGLDAAFFMRRYRDELDFSAVVESIDVASATSPSTREKLVFYKNAFGVKTSGSKDDVYGLGIMSRIFGLHLLKNGITVEGVDKSELIEEIVSMQKPDGGWALMGDYSDVDVTAMCLQALCGEVEENVIGAAVNFLSIRQQEDGGFATMGKSNCESVAQVIIALSSLQIDCATDERFIKEKSAWDALLSYRTETGVFSHEMSGDVGENATVQAISAIVAYDLYKTSGQTFYSLPEYNFGKSQKVGFTPVLPVNAWVAVGIAGAAVILCVVLVLTKKGGWKEVVAVLLVGCGLALFVGLSTFQTVEEYYADTEQEGETITVFVAIRRDTVNSSDPIIFEGDVNVKENATVLDAVIWVTRQNRLQLSYIPGYISSIDSLAEFSYGNESGWMFAVNGVFSNKNCSEMKLKEGDEVYFLYSRNMGKDVASFFEEKDEK